MNKKATRLASALIIAVVGMYLLIVLLNAMKPVFTSGFFVIPGRFLFLSFLEAAFYLPLLFLISSFLLFADYYNARIFSAKLISLVPFFSLSLLLRVLNYIPGSRAADLVIDNIGVRGGSLVLGLVFLLGFLLVFRVLVAGKAPVPAEKPAAKNAQPAQAPEARDVPEHSFNPVPLKFTAADAVAEPAEEVEEVETVEVEEVDDADETTEANETDEAAQDDTFQVPDDLNDSPEEITEDEPEVEDFSFENEEYEEQAVEPLDLDPDAGHY